MLVEKGFIECKYGMTCKTKDKMVTCTTQHNFIAFIKQKYGISVYRRPDEAYVTEFTSSQPKVKKVVRILEKKMQNVDGSVETKLFASPSLKREYELMFGPEFEIQYALCVSEFLKNKIMSGQPKYNNLKKILNENNIPILFGNDADYYKQLELWIE